MGKANPDVSIPGAPAAASASPQTSAEAASADDKAEIARLRALLTARAEGAENGPEFDGPNTRRYKAESKHLHLTTTELHAMVAAGDAKLTDHHVLCKDGWFVNPAANAHANG